MLVLTRCVGESFVIGDSVVRILGMSGHAVKVGIEAPKDVVILRSEVAAKIARDGPRNYRLRKSD